MECASSRLQCGQVLLLVVLLYGQRTHASSTRLLIVGSEVAENEGKRGMNSSLPNYDLYHRSDVFQKELKALVDRHPLIMTMEVLQAEGLKDGGNEGYHTEMTIVTVEAGGKGARDDQNMRLLLDFGQHGRELVTSEVAFRLLQILGGEHPLGDIDAGTLYRILPHATIKIVPMENLNGRRRVEAGDLCERKNGRGVDPNRNWGVDWGKKEKDYDPSEEYPGIAPFSEPETKILRNLAESFKPHVWVNVHSGMEALFMPYDHKTIIPVDGGPAMKSLLQILNKQHCEDKCVIGSGGDAVGYLAHGTATDYMYDMLRVPMAFTWEIYGDMAQPENECFQMFNPATPSKFEAVVSTWSSSFLTLLINLPRSLHSIPNRYPTLEVWDWESWPISSLPEIPDLELRKRFSAFTDPLPSAGDSGSIEMGAKSRLGVAVAKSEVAGLFHEFLVLLGGVLVLLIFFKLCGCYCARWNPVRYARLFDRGRRIPV
ncbi:unnamed protein product [Calypogeia fissa]